MQTEHGARRVEDFGALLRAAQTAHPNGVSSLAERRQLVADLCRMLGQQQADETSPAVAAQTQSLSPRLSQTLDALLAGDSEKQIAHKLSISQHTVHVYVKALYKGFDVSSRAELLARFINKRRSSRISNSNVASPIVH